MVAPSVSYVQIDYVNSVYLQFCLGTVYKLKLFTLNFSVLGARNPVSHCVEFCAQKALMEGVDWEEAGTEEGHLWKRYGKERKQDVEKGSEKGRWLEECEKKREKGKGPQPLYLKSWLRRSTVLPWLPSTIGPIEPSWTGQVLHAPTVPCPPLDGYGGTASGADHYRANEAPSVSESGLYQQPTIAVELSEADVGVINADYLASWPLLTHVHRERLQRRAAVKAQ